MRWFMGLVLAFALGVAGCSGSAGVEGSAFPKLKRRLLTRLRST